ncbi:GNAT family N-acetyltransferase [Paenibacillus pini]
MDIEQLQHLCEQTDGISLKLNWGTLNNRIEGQETDFFRYEGQLLIGFLALYSFGNEVEACGMVHPDYRRQGIFLSLWNEAKIALCKHDVSSILMNTPAKSSSGTAFLKSIGYQQSHSEFQMQWSPDVPQDVTNQEKRVQLRQATSQDILDLITMDIEAFGITESEEEAERSTSEPKSTVYVIEHEDDMAGKIKLETIGDRMWIYGFVVIPSKRGQGIGTSTLKQVISLARPTGLSLWLEVALHNPGALRLYESCGFVIQQQQDYYTKCAFCPENVVQ